MTQSTIPPCKSADVASYIAGLLRDPYERSGQHCWALVRRVQSELFGRTLPVILEAVPDAQSVARAAYDEHRRILPWHEVEEPQHGDVVIMRKPMYLHSGVFLRHRMGGILHTDEPDGVMFETLTQIRAVRRFRCEFWTPG